MKILILYATKNGNTRFCAEYLANRLNVHHEATVCDVEENPLPPDAYDAIVLGSSIRMGRIRKAMKAYLKTYCDLLSARPTAFFFCCGYPKHADEYAETELPRKLQCALGIHCFGGELKPDKLKGFDKIAVRMIRSSINSQDFEESDADHHQLPELLLEDILLLADQIEKLRLS